MVNKGRVAFFSGVVLSVAEPESGAFFDPWIQDPDPECKTRQDPGTWMNILDLVFENFVSVFCGKNT